VWCGDIIGRVHYLVITGGSKRVIDEIFGIRP